MMKKVTSKILQNGKVNPLDEHQQLQVEFVKKDTCDRERRKLQKKSENNSKCQMLIFNEPSISKSLIICQDKQVLYY